MTVKEFLEGVRESQRKINLLAVKIEKVRGQMSLHGVSYGDGVKTSLAADQIADNVSKVADYEKELRKENAELEIKREKALLIIGHLPDRKERLFMKCYYLSKTCEPLEKMSDKDEYFTYYDWQSTLANGLEHLEQIRQFQSEPKEKTLPELLKE